MYAATASAPAANSTARRAMSTYKMAGKHQQFEFFATPRFVSENTELSAEAKLLYGFYNSKAGQRGYLDNYTREQIRAELGFKNLKQLDRAKAECKAYGLLRSLQAGDARPNVVVLLAHPDMNLTQKELEARQIKLPPKISLMLDRDRKRKGSALTTGSKLTPSALTNVSTPKEISLKDQETEEEKKARPLAQAITPASQIDNSEQIAPSITSTSEPHPEPETASTNSTDSPTPAQPKPPKPPKARKPRSKYSLELCLRFAQAEQARKGTIEDVQDFGEACYWIGRHDQEINRWLKCLATAQVGKMRPSASDASESVAQPHRSEPSATEAARQALQRRLELERLRAIAFDSLSPNERAQRLQAKREELMASEHRSKYKRMSAEQFQAHLIGQLQRDLVPG